jgi:CHAT domain-containing protein
VVHLACHGLFATDQNWANPLKSGLLLGDGYQERVQRNEPIPDDCLLTAQELFGLNLNADLVTLRACSSGRTHVQAGDELVGLSRAFLYGGTPSLLVSLWNVNTKSSYSLLEAFYQKWLQGAGMPKWKALQQAQHALLYHEDERYHHPYHWAPFVLIGDWI